MLIYSGRKINLQVAEYQLNVNIWAMTCEIFKEIAQWVTELLDGGYRNNGHDVPGGCGVFFKFWSGPEPEPTVVPVQP